MKMASAGMTLLVGVCLAVLAAACEEGEEEAMATPTATVTATAIASPTASPPASPSLPAATPTAAPETRTPVATSTQSPTAPTVSLIIDAVPSEPICGPIKPANVETCISVESVETGPGVPGPVFDVDVLINGTVPGDALDGFNYNLNFPDIGPSPNGVTNWVHVDKFLNCMPGSNTADASNGGLPPPLGISPLFACGVDQALGAAETNPFFVSGVLGTYTLDVTGLAAGLYSLSLDTAVLADDGVRCGFVADLQDRDCDNFADDPASLQGAIVGVDTPCPEAVNNPSAAEDKPAITED